MGKLALRLLKRVYAAVRDCVVLATSGTIASSTAALMTARTSAPHALPLHFVTLKT